MTNEYCRVTADLREYDRMCDQADKRGAMEDELADKLYNAAIGYRKDCSGEAWDYFESKSDKELIEIFAEYMARKFAPIEPGVTDDRDIVADEFLLEYIREACEQEAERDIADQIGD